MSSELVFDTLQYANKLKAAGISEKQAEIHAEAIAEIIDNKLATKRDLKELELATKRDLKELRLATKRNLRELELRMTVKLGSIMIGGIGFLVILMKLFNL